jgi:hypothetical protein
MFLHLPKPGGCIRDGRLRLLKRVTLSWGDLVGTLPSKHPPEHQIIHLELSATHEPLLIALECLAVPCIFNSKLPSSCANKVDIFVSELVLCNTHFLQE